MEKIILSVLSFASFLTFSQSFEWVSQIEAASTNTGYDVATDAAGNVYVAGQFSGYTNFNPSGDAFGMTSVGIFDAFAAKYNPSGNLIWAVQLGGAPDEGAIARGIALDDEGNVLIVGDFTGTADFDPGAGTANLTSFSNDIFICKLNNSGGYVWAHQIGGGSSAFGMDVAADSDGNVYTAGYFQGVTDFDPSAASFNLTAVNGDGFLSKLDADGNFDWAFQIGSSSGDSGNAIYIDELDQIYFTGSFSNTADFDPSGDSYSLSSAGSADVFLMKITADATLTWATSFGSVDEDYGYGIAVDPFGNVYATGVFDGTVDFDPSADVSSGSSNGLYDIYVSKFTSSGNFIWSRQLGGPEYDFGVSLATDDNGAVYLGGIFQGTCDMDPGAATNNVTSLGDRDMFIEKLDSAGNFISVKTFGANLADNLKAVHVGSTGEIYATGEFNNEVDFDPNAGTVTLTSTGQQDAFVLKLSQHTAGFFEENKAIEIALFPNPVATTLQVICQELITDIAIYTVGGALVQQEKTTHFSVEKLEPGFYILEVKTATALTQVKFMKV